MSVVSYRSCDWGSCAEKVPDRSPQVHLEYTYRDGWVANRDGDTEAKSLDFCAEHLKQFDETFRTNLCSRAKR